MFGEIIRNRRRLLRIRQSDLAELADVSLRNVIAIEKGEANPSLETLTKLANVLGLELTLTAKS